MLTIIIPTLNAERVLGPTLASLVSGAVSGIVKDVIVVDGGSQDGTVAIAEGAGCEVIGGCRGRGAQLAAGAEAARGEWFLFLHADTVLQPGWDNEIRQFVEEAEMSGDVDRAACFRFRLNSRDAKARWVERGVSLRCLVLALPYGDQGLIVSRSLYAKVGGFKPVPLMEDVDMVRRIGRRRLKKLHTQAVTSAERYMREGFMRRASKNLFCLGLYYLRVPRSVLARFYGT